MIKRISVKLGNMRKAADWVVYPGATVDRITIQSDHRIALINGTIGKAILSKHVGGGAYNHHLMAALGATVVPVAQDIIDAALAAVPQSGDEIGPGVRIA